MNTAQTAESVGISDETAAIGDTAISQPVKRMRIRTAGTERVSGQDRAWQVRGRALNWVGSTGLSVSIEATAPLMRFGEISPSDSSCNTSFVIQMIVPHTSTSNIDDLTVATLGLRTAFAEARAQLTAGESSEDVHEQFRSKVEALFWKFGQVAFEAASRIILVEGAEPRLGLSALRAAGDINDGSVHETRLTLARNALQSRVPELRYGALHVFADLGDGSAVPDIRKAAGREPIAALRSDMNKVSSLLVGAS